MEIRTRRQSAAFVAATAIAVFLSAAPLPCFAQEGGENEAEALREQGLGLSIDAESVKDRRQSTNTDLRIGQYGFFAQDGENRYSALDERKEVQADTARSAPFTPSFPAEGVGKSGAEKIAGTGIFSKPKEYSQGVYDESGDGGSGAPLLVCFFAAIGAGTFFATRQWCRHRRRKAEKCT